MIKRLKSQLEKILLAERYSAWESVARKLAHEIKNPLTPMKLNVQHLERSLDPNDVNFKDQLKNFSKKIIQQIDTLTSIANEFSRFAKMPKLQLKKIDLKDILSSTLDFFKNQEDILFSIEDNDLKNVYIEGDLDQLVRVFNNIINNAIQSIEDNSKGEIIIIL